MERDVVLNLNHTTCQIQEAECVLDTTICDRCQQPAPRFTTLQHQVKVGNDPALYVLARDKSLSPDGSGIYAVGMAQPIPAPLDTAYMWSRAMDFGLLPDGSAYHVICDAGYTTWSAHAPVLGVLPYSSSSAWKSISMLPDGTGFYALDRDGRIQRTDGAEPLAIANLPAGQMQDIAVTPDGRGLMAMDRRGRVYSAGTAPVLALPSPLPFPENQAIARSLEMTADGRGYYILDNYGRLWAAGTAQALTANYEVHLGEDWARDFAVTENGEGYYMLDKYGNIHTGGDAPDITINLPPTWTDAQALSLKLLDSRSSDQPRLVTSQTSVSFVTVPGAASQSLSIELLSDCGQDLTWSVSLSPSVPWLTVFQSGSRTPSSLLLMVSGDLQVGTYSTTLVFSAVDGEGNPVQTQEVPVTVRVWERVHTVQLPLILSQR